MSFVILNVIMLSFVMLNAIVLNVMAPSKELPFIINIYYIITPRSST